jgi:hypothetical protein
LLFFYLDQIFKNIDEIQKSIELKKRKFTIILAIVTILWFVLNNKTWFCFGIFTFSLVAILIWAFADCVVCGKEIIGEFSQELKKL